LLCLGEIPTAIRENNFVTTHICALALWHLNGHDAFFVPNRQYDGNVGSGDQWVEKGSSDQQQAILPINSAVPL
jgi:hypothetical protein